MSQWKGELGLNQLIKEIKNNLSNGNYLSSLALTLILPDICGEIAFPKVKFNRKDIHVGTMNIFIHMNYLQLMEIRIMNGFQMVK